MILSECIKNVFTQIYPHILLCRRDGEGTGEGIDVRGVGIGR